MKTSRFEQSKHTIFSCCRMTVGIRPRRLFHLPSPDLLTFPPSSLPSPSRRRAPKRAPTSSSCCASSRRDAAAIRTHRAAATASCRRAERERRPVLARGRRHGAEHRHTLGTTLNLGLLLDGQAVAPASAQPELAQLVEAQASAWPQLARVLAVRAPAWRPAAVATRCRSCAQVCSKAWSTRSGARDGGHGHAGALRAPVLR